jgi:hypothetical protein
MKFCAGTDAPSFKWRVLWSGGVVLLPIAAAELTGSRPPRHAGRDAAGTAPWLQQMHPISAVATAQPAATRQRTLHTPSQFPRFNTADTRGPQPPRHQPPRQRTSPLESLWAYLQPHSGALESNLHVRSREREWYD